MNCPLLRSFGLNETYCLKYQGDCRYKDNLEECDEFRFQTLSIERARFSEREKNRTRLSEVLMGVNQR